MAKLGLRPIASLRWCLLLSFTLLLASAIQDARSETLDIPQTDNQLIRRFANSLLPPEDETLPLELGTGGSEEALVAAVRRSAFAAELLKKLRTGEPLERYEPYGWHAIPAQLCIAAKLPEGRCVSVACLTAQSANVNVLSKECKLSASAMSAPSVPPQPSAAGEWRNWLTEIPREGLPADVAEALSRGELPVNQTVLTAKGHLHAIWPALVRKAAEFSDLSAAELPALVAGVMTEEALRSAKAAQIVAVATLADDLPVSTKLFLTRQEPELEGAFSDLTAAATALDALFDEPATLFRLPDNADELLTKGAAAVETLRGGIRYAIAKLPQIAVNDAVEYVAEEICPPLVDTRLFPIAARQINIHDTSQGAQFEFALREIDRLPDGEITAELVAAISLPLAEQFDGDGNPVDKAKWKCLGELRQVFPLGITISRLRESDGRLLLVARDNELVQRAEAAQFRSGIVGLATRLASPVTWPTAIEVEGIVLEFSPDLSDVTLKASVYIPLLDHGYQSVVPLVRGGQIPDDPDVAMLLDLEGLIASVNRRIEKDTAGRQVAVGPFSATIAQFELAMRAADARPGNPTKTRLAADKRWLSARARLNAGPVAIEDVLITLIERDGQVLFVPEVDLTPLFRAALEGVLNSLAEKGASLGDAMRVHLQRSGEAASPFVDAITRALMIQHVELDGSGHVAITLGLDIGMIAGQDPLVFEHSGRLNFERDDLGLPPLYAALAEKAVQNGTAWINVAIGRINASVGDLVDADVQVALKALVSKAQEVGITLEFKRREDASYDVRVQLAGITTLIKEVRLVTAPPDLDFRNATITSDAEVKLTDALISEFNRKIPLNWAKCGSSRISKGALGFVIELGVESDLVGCLPLPAIVFDGKRLSLDEERSKAAILAALKRRLAQLLPEDIARYVGDATFGEDFRTLLVPFAAELPGMGGIKLSGTATIDLSNGSFKVKVDNKEALFAEAFQFVAGNIGGDDWKVEPMPDQIGVIASGRIDFGVFGIAVEGLQVTTGGIRIPELSARLPAAIPLGPFTVFPTEVKARVQRPYSVMLVGDVGLFGASSIAMLRGSMRFDDIPPKQMEAVGTIILLTSLELFRAETLLRFSPFVIEGKSETIGLLKAIMPFSQTMRIDAKEAALSAKAEILGVQIDGSGQLLLSNNPSLTLTGHVSAGNLAEFAAGLQSDLDFTDPTANVNGRVGFLLGDIKVGADANLRRAKLHAEVIGIPISVTVPTLTHIDAAMIEALFAFLLKPSIDLSTLRELNVQLSPRIAGGGDSATGDTEGNGGVDEGGEQNSDTPHVKGGPPITDPEGAIRTGAVPSEWQSGWVSGDDGQETVCYARWRGSDKTDPNQFQWLGSRKVPRPVAELLSRTSQSNVVDLGYRQIETSLYRNCSSPDGTMSSTSVRLFLSDNPPIIWAYGSTSYATAPWVKAVIDKVDGADRDASAGISRTARDIVAFMFEHGIESADQIRRIDLATGRHFWIIALPEQPIMVRDADLGMQVHPRAGPIGRWLSAMSTEPPSGAIAERLLPALFIGRSAPVAIYPYDPTDTPEEQPDLPQAILLGHVTADGPIIVPLSLGEKGGCGNGIRVRGVKNWRGVGYSEKYAQILAALIESSPGCDYWDEIEIVGPPGGGEPDRLIMVHEGPDDWRIAFTDRLQVTECLRNGLDFDRLQTSLGQWRDKGALSEPELDQLLTSGLSLVRRVLSDAAADWRSAGFPFNPLILARCEEAQ